MVLATGTEKADAMYLTSQQIANMLRFNGNNAQTFARVMSERFDDDTPVWYINEEFNEWCEMRGGIDPAS